MKKLNFAVSLGSTIAIVTFALFNWVSVVYREGEIFEYDFSLLGFFSFSSDIFTVYRIWGDGIQRYIVISGIFISILICLLVVAVTLQIIALVGRYNGQHKMYWANFAYWGYGLSIAVSLGFLATVTNFFNAPRNLSWDMDVSLGLYFVLFGVAVISEIVSGLSWNMDVTPDLYFALFCAAAIVGLVYSANAPDFTKADNITFCNGCGMKVTAVHEGAE
jgi:hypothetical protein